MSRQRRSLLPAFVRRSYAARLGVALAFSVVVITAFGFVISAQASDTLEADVQEQLTSQSSAQAAQLDTWLAAISSDARSTSTQSVFASGDRDRIESTLKTKTSRDRVPEDVVGIHYLNTETMEIETSTVDEMIGIDTREQGAAFAQGDLSFENSDGVVVTDPFEVPVVDHPIVAVISPVGGAENRALVYMVDIESHAQAFSQGEGDTWTVVVDQQGRFVAHPNASKILRSHRSGDSMVSMLGPGESDFMAQDDVVMGMTRMENTGWTVMTHAESDTAYALVDQINSDLIGLVLLAIINLGLIGVTIGSNTLNSLKRLTARAEEMADGDLDVNLQTDREDEIGSLYGSFATMRDSLRERIAEAQQAKAEAETATAEAEQARQDAEAERAEMESMTAHLTTKANEYEQVLDSAADGDLTARVDADSESDAMKRVGEKINATLASLETTIADVETFASEVLSASDRVGSNADRVERASEQVTDSIEEIFEGTQQQSDQLQDAAGEMENLSATAEEVASSAQEVASTSQAAAEAGQDGQQAAQLAIDEMEDIDDRTDEMVAEINQLDDDLDEINEILGVITDVVEQTNMLALNASIEAAHADGEGDGFAVVADEIKTLAEETKSAAGDIEQRIERIQAQATDTVDTMEDTSERITDGVSTVTEAVDALETIVARIEEADSGIQEIDAATEEQAESAQQVMTMLDELSSISQQTAAEADTVAGAADDQSQSIGEVSASAEQLRRRADELRELLDRFTVDGSAADARTNIDTDTAATDD